MKIIKAEDIVEEERLPFVKKKMPNFEFYNKKWLKDGCPMPGCKSPKGHEPPHICFLDQEIE